MVELSKESYVSEMKSWSQESILRSLAQNFQNRSGVIVSAVALIKQIRNNSSGDKEMEQFIEIISASAHDIIIMAQAMVAYDEEINKLP